MAGCIVVGHAHTCALSTDDKWDSGNVKCQMSGSRIRSGPSPSVEEISKNNLNVLFPARNGSTAEWRQVAVQRQHRPLVLLVLYYWYSKVLH